MADLRCIVVTPETTAYDERADFVALTLYDGEAGIAPGRTAMIGRLGYGEMRVKQGEKTVRYYVEGGFVEMLGDTLSVLTNRAIPAENLSTDIAKEQLESAMSRPANTPELMAIRDRAVAISRAQLWVARR